MPVRSIDASALEDIQERDDHEILSHIVPEEGTLAAQTAVSSHCVALYEVVTVCFYIEGNEIIMTLKIYDVPVGRTTITPDDACAGLSGHLDGVSIQVEACLHMDDDLVLTLEGALCVPLVGCKEFQKTFHL